MSGDEVAEAQKSSTASEAGQGGAQPSAPAGAPIIAPEPFGAALERPRPVAPPPGLRRPPTARVGKVGDTSVSYDLAGDAIEIPSVLSTQNVSRSVLSTANTSPAPSSAAPLNKKVLLLSVAVALLAVTNAITAYKLYSGGGQGAAVASVQPNDATADSAGPAPAIRPGAAHPKAAGSAARPKPAAGAARPRVVAEPEPELPPVAALAVEDVQEWDAARFAKAKIVEAKSSLNGKLCVFRTPGCTSFVKFPAEALPASMVQALGETPDIFRVNHAKGTEPILDCKMQGGSYIQVRLSKKSGPEEDLLRHSATILAVAKRGQEEILYVCALPNNACPSLLTNLSAVPDTLMVVPAQASGGRNPLVLIPYANPSSLVIKCRKSPKDAWSNVDTSSDLEIPSVGKVTFKSTGASGSKWLTLSTEPDQEFSDLAEKCNSLPPPAVGEKPSPEQEHMLQILGIAEGYSLRIEDAAGRKVAAFHLSLAIPRNNPSQD